VANESRLAASYDLSIGCRIVYVSADRLKVTKDFKGRLIFPAKDLNPVLEARRSGAFICPFREELDRLLGFSALDNPKEAQIQLLAEYRMPLWWPAQWLYARHSAAPETFTLAVRNVPAVWIKGEPLR
jgi:hypothetical protein